MFEKYFVDEHRDIKKIDITATLACLTALLFWSLGPIFIKYLTSYVDAWTQNFLRYLTACLFWLPFLLFSNKTSRFDKRIWRKSVVPAVANHAMQSFYAGAFYYI